MFIFDPSSSESVRAYIQSICPTRPQAPANLPFSSSRYRIPISLFNHPTHPPQTNPNTQYHLALLALGASAIIIIDPLPVYISLSGWHACPNQCVIAVANETPSAAQEPVCFDEPAHDPPCSYCCCLGKPVGSATFLGHVKVGLRVRAF